MIGDFSFYAKTMDLSSFGEEHGFGTRAIRLGENKARPMPFESPREQDKQRKALFTAA